MAVFQECTAVAWNAGPGDGSTVPGERGCRRVSREQRAHAANAARHEPTQWSDIPGAGPEGGDRGGGRGGKGVAEDEASVTRAGAC